MLTHLTDTALPRGRVFLKSMVNEELDTLSVEWEKQFSQQVVESIRTSKTELDASMPNESDLDKMSKLVDHVSEQFTDGVTVAFRELYPAYAAKMDRLRSYIDGINTSDGVNLSDKEKIHRELIRTFLRLIVLENSKRG